MEWNPQASEMPLEIKVDSENIFIHFDNEFTAVYSKNLCSLFQTWKPGANEAWYLVPPSVYHHQRENPVWDVWQGQRSILKQAEFSSYTLEANAIFLRYTLTLGNGKRISIVETPKYDAHYGAPRLMRNMTITGISQGEEVRLRLSDYLKPVFWRLSGGGELDQRMDNSRLVVTRDGFSQVLVIWDR